MLSFLTLPETRGLDLDSPEAVLVHKNIIQQKVFLRRLYNEYYQFFVKQARLMSSLPGEMLELGSGGGFLKDILREVVTSDVAAYPTVDRVVFADKLPFSDGSLKAIFMVDVLHHVPEPNLFFAEAQRCLVPGGRVVMIEPFNSWLGRVLYKNFHHEPFDETVTEWRVKGEGRLSAANQALPWIIFWRDRALFSARYPDLEIIETKAHTVLRYLLSGGLSWKALAPGLFYGMSRWVDRQLSRFPSIFPLFQTIVLRKK